MGKKLHFQRGSERKLKLVNFPLWEENGEKISLKFGEIDAKGENDSVKSDKVKKTNNRMKRVN